jgi:fluoride ion exporter CrcB/FEX
MTLQATPDASTFVRWLDQTLGPPWSGLVVLALIGALTTFSAYVAVQTINYVYRDKP